MPDFEWKVFLNFPVNKSERGGRAEDDIKVSSGLSSDQSGNFCSHRCQHILMIVEPGQTGPP